MKTIKDWSASIVGILTVLFTTGTANAADPLPAYITSTDQVVKLLCNALGWMFWALMVLGIAMFIVGGYLYATSSGEAEKVGKATKTLLYAAIAIAVGLIARGIPVLVATFIGASGPSVC